MDAPEYLRRAEEAQKVADAATDRRVARDWGDMAEHWRELAVQADARATPLWQPFCDWPGSPARKAERDR